MVKKLDQKDMTLIDPKREIMKILGHPRTFLEAWNEGAMEYWETGLCCASPKKVCHPPKPNTSLFPEIATRLLHYSINVLSILSRAN